MRPGDRELAARLEKGLRTFSDKKKALPGVRDASRRAVLVQQLIESVRRIEFIAVLLKRPLSESNADPNDVLFDPLKAAIVRDRQGNREEAFWLIFLFVHFGKSASAGWRYVREIYGRFGEGRLWDWAHTSADPGGFRKWLHDHQDQLRRKDVPGGFGNHRKRESLDALSPKGTGAAIESYVRWVAPPRTQQELVQEAIDQAGGDRRQVFDRLYHSMEMVMRFGRLARFDYLAMIGKLKLASIEPGSTYLKGSSGPLKGARLLFGEHARAPHLDAWLADLGAELNVGMQVLEDGLCNWQKSPDKFIAFRG